MALWYWLLFEPVRRRFNRNRQPERCIKATTMLSPRSDWQLDRRMAFVASIYSSAVGVASHVSGICIHCWRQAAGSFLQRWITVFFHSRCSVASSASTQIFRHYFRPFSKFGGNDRRCSFEPDLRSSDERRANFVTVKFRRNRKKIKMFVPIRNGRRNRGFCRGENKS